jgi:hypothetical protein
MAKQRNTTAAPAPAPAEEVKLRVPAEVAAAEQANPEGAEQALQSAAEAGTVEAVEQANPEGVATITEPVGDDEAAKLAQDMADLATGAAAAYAVAWSIKFNGKRYDEGDSVQLTPEQAAPFLASGAIVKA